MRYALAFLSARPQILHQLQFHSIDDLCFEKNFQDLPAVLDNSFGGKISAKTFSDAFNLKSAPNDTTLAVVEKQFEIELSFREFKQKLKEKDANFISYLETESAESKRMQKLTDEKNEDAIPSQLDKIKHDEVITKTLRFQGWFNANKFALIIPTTILIIVFVMITMKGKENPVKDDFEKKQVETVLAFYKKLKSYSIEVKFVLMNRYSHTASWAKDSADSFYESQIAEIPFLRMEELLFPGKKGIAKRYFSPRLADLAISSPDQIIDSFGGGIYAFSPEVLMDDSTLPNKIPIGDMTFASKNIFDNEIIEYSHSPLLPVSIKSRLLAFNNRTPELKTLNKIITESAAEIIILGPKGTIRDNFTGITPLTVWYDPLKPSQRLYLGKIFDMIRELEKSIIDFLESKGITIH